MRCVAPLFTLVAVLALAGCGDSGEDVAQTPEEAVAAAEGDSAAEQAQDEAEADALLEGATPNAERVATLALLNKRNNLSEEVEIKPGETKAIGRAIVRLESCERTPEWEPNHETGAFVQLFVDERRPGASEPDVKKVFSGWLFKNSPAVNVVEHPVYDVWVKHCAMNFPGESPAAAAAPESEENAAASETGAEAEEE